MQLQSETIGDCLVVTILDERIDAGTAIQFKDEMRKVIGDAPQRVVLDLKPVDSIDSSGLGAIVSVMKIMGPDRPLELAGLSTKVQTVFRLTRMDSVVTIHSSREAALGAYSRAS
ncbi:STAS domain-containing protein [Ovoidimarina sediminis]|uniref:STAS domain-containing protein n=1 Tax=Ovoidimarina sediminis TaxID=3079856 RepID=UPI00290C69B8|nr:STAS domain-containing protein [Rhodophyticola sp. MJ-SS7]MDU8943807.1 STAS domain-containing protein [Rhodophyticola sp. MJ-SS7]